MTKLLIVAVAGAAGFGLGLWVARQAYQAKVTDAIHSGLAKVGLDNTAVEDVADKLVLGN